MQIKKSGTKSLHVYSLYESVGSSIVKVHCLLVNHMTTALVEPPNVYYLVTYILKCRYVPVHQQKATWGTFVSMLNHTQLSLLYGQPVVAVKFQKIT